MKKVLKIFLLSLVAIIFSLSLVGCQLDGGSTRTKPGISGSVKAGTTTYVINKYNAEKDVTSLTISKEALNLPVNVTQIEIKDKAFMGNTSLESVIVSSDVVKIGSQAFAKMTKLESLELPFVGKTIESDPTQNNSGDGSNKSVDASRTIAHIFGTETYNGGSSVSVNYGGENSSTVFIPETLKTIKINPKENSNYNIPMYAFNGVTAFEEIILGANVEGIGEYAFASCGGIETFAIPASVKTIYMGAFENCYIKNFVLESTASAIEVKEDAFKGCNNLSYFGEVKDTLPTYTIDLAKLDLTKLGDNAFDLSSNQLTYEILNAGTVDIQTVFGETKIAE